MSAVRRSSQTATVESVRGWFSWPSAWIWYGGSAKDRVHGDDGAPRRQGGMSGRWKTLMAVVVVALVRVKARRHRRCWWLLLKGCMRDPCTLTPTATHRAGHGGSRSLMGHPTSRGRCAAIFSIAGTLKTREVRIELLCVAATVIDPNWVGGTVEISQNPVSFCTNISIAVVTRPCANAKRRHVK